jgi:hypothetical protein
MGKILYYRDYSEPLLALEARYKELNERVLSVVKARDPLKTGLPKDLEEEIKEFVQTSDQIANGIYIGEREMADAYVQHLIGTYRRHTGILLWGPDIKTSGKEREIVILRDVSLEDAAEMAGVSVSDLET